MQDHVWKVTYVIIGPNSFMKLLGKVSKVLSMVYNPFKKPIREPLTPEDLEDLVTNTVSEGYNVEYKGTLPASKKIAHTIASFANTYGGWYIVGVTTDGHNIAQQITGFSLDDYHDPIASVRDSIRLGINPVPVL